jgi:leucyl aminopeptidase
MVNGGRFDYGYPMADKAPATVVDIVPTASAQDFAPDALVVVAAFCSGASFSGTPWEFLDTLLDTAAAVDQRVRHSAVLVPIGVQPAGTTPAGVGRIVACPVSLLDFDSKDIRGYADAALVGMRLAVAAGAQRPLLVVHAHSGAAPVASCVFTAAVAAAEVFYSPLEAREDAAVKAGAIPALLTVTVGLASASPALGATALAQVATEATATNAGLSLARDLCGGSPERHTPLRVATSIQRAFAGSGVEVEVIQGKHRLAQDYPLLAAVDRGSVPRHAGCVIKLCYQPPGVGEAGVTANHLLVGKGVAMDTGGVNLKGNGGGGMARDKGGAAAVAGLMLAVSRLQPPSSFTAYLCMVRNSIGSDGESI